MSRMPRTCGFNYKLAGMVSLAPLEGLNDGARKTLGRLASFADRHGRDIRPSITRLARETGTPRSTMMRHIKQALDAGYLVADGYHIEHGKRVAKYRLNVERLNETLSHSWDGNSSDHVSPVGQGGVSPVGHNQFREINSDPYGEKAVVDMKVYARAHGAAGLSDYERAEQAYYAIPSTLMQPPPLSMTMRRDLHALVDKWGLTVVERAIQSIANRDRVYKRVQVEWIADQCKPLSARARRLAEIERMDLSPVTNGQAWDGAKGGDDE